MEENKKWSGNKNNKKFRHNNYNNQNNQNKSQNVNNGKQQQQNVSNSSNGNNNTKKQNSNNQSTPSNNNNKNNNYRTGNNNNNNYRPNNRNNNYKNYNNRQNNNNRSKPEKTVEEYEKEYLEKKKSSGTDCPICPVCKEPIYMVETAIKHSSTGSLAHFDCILNELSSSNELEKNEKIVYLGSGTFGIIQERSTNKNDRMKFFVRKRITYEDRKEKEEVNTDVDVEEVFDV